jgi:hypothetical protein
MNKWLTVTKNEIGLDEYDHGVYRSENLVGCEMQKEEFDILWSLGLFNAINEACDLMIDEFEEETIKKEHFEICNAIIENTEGIPKDSVFVKMFNLAKEIGLSLELDF